MHTATSTRVRWIGALVGVLAYVSGLQKRYVLHPLTTWLRDLPAGVLVPLVLALIAALVWYLWHREADRRRRVKAAGATIDASVGAGLAP